MKDRFNSRIVAAALISLAALYMVLSLAMGRSASAEPLPDLSLKAADAGIGVWKAAGAALDGALFVDVRSPAKFARYHVKSAVNVPDADPAALRAAAKSREVIVVAPKDDDAQRRVAAARAADPNGKYFYLQNGVRDWYLTFELPVAMFNDQPAPRGYDEALASLKTAMASHDQTQRERGRMALFDLVRMNYQPTLLKSAGTAAAAGGARKKISGGCGG